MALTPSGQIESKETCRTSASGSRAILGSNMRQARLHFAFILPLLAGWIAFGAAAADERQNGQPAGAVLSVEGDRFTLNGVPTFLLGVSYYGGLGAPEDFLRRDLDDLQRLGFNWLRVWATWDSFGENVSAVDANGKGREPYLAKLRSLVEECNVRGMVVDVTLARSRRSDKTAGSVHLPDLESHQQGVISIIEALKRHRNWYLDLANERDVGDDRFVGIDELRQLRNVAKRIDPNLLITASFGGHDLSRDDVRDSLQSAGHDFLSVHRPRHAESPRQTEARTRELLDLLREMKLTAPVHHQEPFRRGYAEWEPTADDFLIDLRGALKGGAAGWCFHNGSQKTAADGQPRRSFDLRERRLFDQLDVAELKVLHRAKAAMVEAGGRPE